MSKFKIGDLVKIKKGLEPDSAKYAGQILKVTLPCEGYIGAYEFPNGNCIKVDGGIWNYNCELIYSLTYNIY